MTIDRFALLAGGACILLGWILEGFEEALLLCVPVGALILAIRHAEELGDYVGWIGRSRITQPSPPWLIRWLCAFALALLALALAARLLRP